MRNILGIILVFFLCSGIVLCSAIAESGMPDEELSPDWSQLVVDSGILISAGYSSSGNENGNIYRAEFEWTEDATPVLKVIFSDTVQEPLTVERYFVSGNTLPLIASLVRFHSMETWAEREDSYQVLDAAHPYLHFNVLDENNEVKTYSISLYAEFADYQWDALNNVRNLILGSICEEYLFETYQASRN